MESGPIESARAQALISADGGTIDARASWDLCDWFGTIWAILLSPLTLVTWLLTFVLSVPLLGLCALFARQTGPVDAVKRTPAFGALCVLGFVAHLPVLCLQIFYCLVVLSVAHLCFAPLGLIVRCGQIKRNWAALYPYLGPPEFDWGDCLAVLLSATARAGFADLLCRYATALSVDPIIKYLVATNPWVGVLASRHCNQWTEPLDSCSSTKEALVLLKHNVSRALHRACSVAPVEHDVFAAHYTKPPKRQPVRRPVPAFLDDSHDELLPHAWGLDLALGGAHFARVGHASSSHKPLSYRAANMAFASTLSYWNPLHPLTGSIEVNVRPNLQLERPMWCVTGQGALAHKLLDNFAMPFFLYAPDISHFNQHRAKDDDSSKRGEDELEAPGPSHVFELAFDQRRLGFTLALLYPDPPLPAVVVVAHADCPDLAVGDVLLRIDDDRPNPAILKHPNHGPPHFNALVARLRDGPRPVRLVFDRPFDHRSPENDAVAAQAPPL